MGNQEAGNGKIMASTETGEMFTDQQFAEMTEQKRQDLGLVPLTPDEEQMLRSMNRKQRREWLRKNKKVLEASK